MQESRLSAYYTVIETSLSLNQALASRLEVLLLSLRANVANKAPSNASLHAVIYIKCSILVLKDLLKVQTIG